MAFFDNLGKKVSEATAKAMQKAQEVSEISRVNSLISEEEKKINATYYQIGKLYVSVHGSDGEENFSGMVAAVLEGEQKINDYLLQRHRLHRQTASGHGKPATPENRRTPTGIVNTITCRGIPGISCYPCQGGTTNSALFFLHLGILLQTAGIDTIGKSLCSVRFDSILPR